MGGLSASMTRGTSISRPETGVRRASTERDQTVISLVLTHLKHLVNLPYVDMSVSGWPGWPGWTTEHLHFRKLRSAPCVCFNSILSWTLFILSRAHVSPHIRRNVYQILTGAWNLPQGDIAYLDLVMFVIFCSKGTSLVTNG